MAGRKQTAMGYEALRQRIQDALEESYPCPPSGGGWPWLIDFYPDDGFLIARVTVKGEHDLYRIMYTVDADGSVELTGDPEAVDTKFALRDTGEVIARQIEARGTLVATGADAQKYLDTLIAKNPLFSSLKDTPNTHLVVFDLTSIGKPSQHQGLVKYQLAKSGLAAAMPTLISKPIHVTAEFDAHFEATGTPKPIGAFLGAEGIENKDGTITLRAIGTLWDSDFPDEVEEIGKKKAELGASYEITYNPLAASRIARDVIELSEYQFSGGAILKKTAAAHPETGMLVAGYRTLDGVDITATWYQGTWQETVNVILASGNLDVLDEGSLQADPITTKERNDLKDSDFALIQKVETKRGNGQRKVRRFPIDSEARRKNAWARINQVQVATDLSQSERSQVKDRIMNRAKREGDSWAKPYKKTNGSWVKGGSAMGKYEGFTEEQAVAIDAFVAAALKESQTDSKVATLEAENTQLKADIKKAGEVAQASITETQGKLAKAETDLLEANKQLKIHQDAAAEAATAAAAVDLKTKVDAKLADLGAKYGFTPKQLGEKRALVEKLVAGKEPMKLEEVEEIYAGAKVVGAPPRVPLVASGGEGDGVPVEKVISTFPGLRKIVPAAR